jgi:O-antigen chain-terminating methyltransferase
MIEVDAAVISPDELILRVQSLLAETPRAGVPAVPYSPRNLPAQSGRGGPELARQRAEVLHQRFKQLGPPEITAGPGLRGKVTRVVKRVVRKLTAWYVEPRWTAQIDFDAATAWAATESANAIGQQAIELQRLSQSIERIERMIEARTAAEDRREREVKAMARAVLDEHEGELAAVHFEVSDLNIAIGTVAARVETMRRQLAAAGPAVARELADGPAAYAIPPLDYTAFEDRFRGSADELKELQRAYLPLFGDPGEYRRIVDIGCGRGEMLELFEEAGFQPVGVDTDVGMLALCRSKDLDVVEADAVLWLQSLEPESIDGIFSAQVIEHLPTEAVVGLVSAAHRALRPGAAMVLETIDPRSVFALCNWFYADLSHVRPVYPPTLAFLCEAAGFSSVEVLPRSPHAALEMVETLPETPEGAATRILLDTVFGHQDYALVARK